MSMLIAQIAVMLLGQEMRVSTEACGVSRSGVLKADQIEVSTPDRSVLSYSWRRHEVVLNKGDHERRTDNVLVMPALSVGGGVAVPTPPSDVDARVAKELRLDGVEWQYELVLRQGGDKGLDCALTLPGSLWRRVRCVILVRAGK